MLKFFVKSYRKGLNLLGKVVLGYVDFLSPFTIKNEYVREVYINNINLFRVHLLVSTLLVLPIVLPLMAVSLTFQVITRLIDLVFEMCDDLRYEAKGVSKAFVRGFREGLKRD